MFWYKIVISHEGILNGNALGLVGTDKSERDVRPKSRLKSTIALSKRLMFQCNYQLVMKTGDIFDGSIKDETVFVLYPSIDHYYV